MIFTKAEIEVLALCAWCKDIPIAQSKNIPADIIETLLYFNYIRPSRNRTGYRCTPEGFKKIWLAGYEYEQDKTYRSDGHALVRRLQTAEITSFFWRYGTNVFCEAPPAESSASSFLPSFALRRKQHANILGGTKLAGFYYSKYFTFIPYYIDKENNGIYSDVEQRTFRAESLLGGNKPYVIYTGAENVDNIIKNVMTRKIKNPKTTTEHYVDAMDKFCCPVAIVPLNSDGMRQLRILETPDCNRRLAKNILGKQYISPNTEQSDGWSKTENFIIGIDCNIRRFEKAINSNRLTNIMMLPFQVNAVSRLFEGSNVVFHAMNIDTVEKLLGLPNELPSVNRSPFQTEKGDYIYVPSLGKGKKV